MRLSNRPSWLFIIRFVFAVVTGIIRFGCGRNGRCNARDFEPRLFAEFAGDSTLSATWT
jgi:hypothetical protein